MKASPREQLLYLFDIVASLCAGFNEHDIQFLSSLLALLRGDLSAQVEAEVGEGEGLTDEQADMERNARRRAEAERETESVMREYNREAKQKERVSLVISHTHADGEEGEKGKRCRRAESR